MPGNGLGDRVHNFFAQDNSLQGRHQSHVVEGNWLAPDNSFWVGSQRQTDALNSNGKNYNSQNSEADVDRGLPSHPIHGKNSLILSQSNPRRDFAKSHSLNEQSNSNSFMYGNQFYQTRKNEANFLALDDTDSDQSHLITSRGLSVHELQQGSGPEHQGKASNRQEIYVPSVSFDLFGSQQQTSHHQSSMLQPLQRQQSGLNEMQQQLMVRKMQELQRQQELRQLDLRPQNQINPSPKQGSGSQSSALVNGTLNSDALQYTNHGTNWLSQGSSMQGPPSGLVFSPHVGQAQHLMDLGPQQVDQSLYGVPVSTSRGLAVNQYSQMVTDRSSMPQVSSTSQHNFFPDQIGRRDGISISRQKFQNENMLGHASSHSQSTGMINLGNLHQVNSIQRTPHDSLGRQEPPYQWETSHERPTRQVTASENEAALDPTEEKILFGSDDNIWDAFGKSLNMTGEADNLFEDGGLSKGFPPIQSGRWSALMQSAVAETSGGNIGPQEDSSGLIFHNSEHSSANQPSSMHNDNFKQPSLSDDKMRMPSALRSGSVPPSGDLNSRNVMGSNQLGQKFQNEPGLRMSQRFEQSLEEAGKWSNRSPLLRSVAEGSEIYRYASQQSLEAERNRQTVSATCSPGQSGSRQQLGWNGTAVPHGADRVLHAHEAEKLSQTYQNNQLRVMQGEVVHGSSLRKPNSVSSSAIELGPVKSTVENHLANKGILSLSDAAAAVANSCNVGVADEASPFVPNNYLLNQWKNANPSDKFQEGEGLGRMLDQVNEHHLGLESLNSCDKDGVAKHEMKDCAVKENSNDSHHSNLSQHTYDDFREGGLSDAIESRSLPPGKQKLSNQLARKVSGPCKFQYHPMGDLDGNVEPSYGLKHPTPVQAISPQNTHFGQSQFFGQVQRNSSVTEKRQSSELQKDHKGPEEEPPRNRFLGYAPNLSAPFGLPLDSCTANKGSSPGQNMLELIHKVDESRDHGSMMHLSSSESNVSSASHGFGLQLGPPSQRLHIPDFSSSSQNAQGTVNLMHSSHTGAGMGEKDQKMVPTSSAQSSPSFNEESQVELKNDRSSGTPYAGSQLQNQQMAMSQHIDSFLSGNATHPMQRGSAETVPTDSSRYVQQDNLATSGSTTQQIGLNHGQERSPAATASIRDHFNSIQHFGMPGISRQGASSHVLHSMWTNVPAPQHTISVQYQKVPAHFSELAPQNIVESGSAPPTRGDLDVSKGGGLSSNISGNYVNSPGVVYGEGRRLKESYGQLLSSVNINSVQKMEESMGEASSMKNRTDDSLANSTSTQKDMEAFGRSLKPDILSNQKYALLNQMRASKDAETDPSIRFSKRMRPDNVLDVHQVNLIGRRQNEHNVIVRDSWGSSTGVPSEDSRMRSSSTAADMNASPHGNVPSQDVVALGPDVSQSNPSTDYSTVRDKLPQVSPQMAPTWFNQYGAPKNGQILPIYNSFKVSSSIPGGPPFFTLGKSSSVLDTPNSEEKCAAFPTDACRIGGPFQNSSSISLPNGQSFFPHSSQLNITGQDQVTLRPRKRKSATCELHPWHKDISNGSQSLSTLRVAEADWSKVANRLTEKVGDGVELIEDGAPSVRSKRRLMLTTQLMQQLFLPPPATILIDYATCKYESVAYAVSRVAHGDACGTVFHSSDLDLARDGVDRLSAKGKPSVRTGDLRLIKVIKELMGRAMKLENDCLRLDKGASLLDVRVECRDLEKFSVINRFAKFHGRGKTDNPETTSVDDTTLKPFPQRYVTPVPVSKNLPDRVQCISL